MTDRLRKPAAHREIIEIIMSIKESEKFPHFENVSKTKIRGLLALMKHSEILLPYINGDDPVKLQLSPEIHDFKTLRKFHDDFLSR